MPIHIALPPNALRRESTIAFSALEAIEQRMPPFVVQKLRASTCLIRLALKKKSFVEGSLADHAEDVLRKYLTFNGHT
jgi:hypothetical protein